MALVVCEEHGPPKGRGSRRYVTAKQPLGYPYSAAICGRRECYEPGLVWLTEEEEFSYVTGRRVFELPTGSVKIAVE